MSEYFEQLRHVCAWNRRLSREVSVLRLKLRSSERELRRLTLANASIAAERDATAVALDAAWKARRR